MQFGSYLNIKLVGCLTDKLFDYGSDISLAQAIVLWVRPDD